MRTYNKGFYKQLSLYILVLVLLVGCGSGGGGDNAGSTSTILSGVASKGPLANGIVTAFSIVNGQKDETLATTETDNFGNYTLNIGSYSGPVLIEATGGTYKDEATGNTKTLNSTFRAAIAEIPPNDSGTTVSVPANVTAITEAAVKNAIAGAGGLTPLNIQTANNEVETQMGFDPVTTQPADASNPSSAIASLAEKVYAFFLGVVSQYLNDNPSKSLDDATSDFAAGLADGSLLTGNVLITAAGNNFSANTNNQTGVLDMTALNPQIAELNKLDDNYYRNQRAVAAALFKDDTTISNCPADTYPSNPSTCKVNYNYNLFGMPGCFSEDSNYIDDLNKEFYQKNKVSDNITWKDIGFICSGTNYYKSQQWKMYNGIRMDGTHNGIDMSHKNTLNHPFYAVTPGVLTRSGDGDFKTIAVYTADPLNPDDLSKGISTIYLHASLVSPKKGSMDGTTIGVCNLDKVKFSECKPATFVSVGDYLGEQGNSSTPNNPVPYHVHISVRSGKELNAVGCSKTDKNCETGDGYMPPIETILKMTPSLAEFSSISAGWTHTVALKSDGTLRAWGYNANGELGDGTNINKNTPTRIGTATNWTAISAAYSHTVALKSDGTLWAWGYNANGELGDGTNIYKYTPTQIGTATNWTAISAAHSYTVALKSDGTLWAWGNNAYGQLGDGTNSDKNTPTRSGTAANWAAISTGGARTVALKSDGTLWAWGYLYGQLDDGTNIDKNTPTRIGTATDWTAISAGWSHTVALKSDGTLWAWGLNGYGQLGDGTNIDKNTPTQIGTDLPSSIVTFVIGQF